VPSDSFFLNDQFLRRLEHLRYFPRQRVAGHMRGIHRSRRTGSGMIFTDFRPYSPGDDTRNLDWGTYLRLDRLMMRLFEEEADFPIYILVDACASLDFGTPSKFDVARRVAAAMAYVGLINMDRVSIVSWSDGVHEQMPARRGKQQVWRTLHFLDRLRPAGRTNLLNTVTSYFGASRTRGLVILISDFMDRDGVEQSFQFLRPYRHQMFVFHVQSREEKEPVLGDEVMLVDAEEGTTLRAQITPQLLGAYQSALAAHGQRIEEYCRSHGWGHALVMNDGSFEDLMLKTLREKGVVF
jgi:uncharacterized protein (DUF58 family)